MTLDELNSMEKADLIAQVVKIQGAHSEYMEKHVSLLKFVEDVKGIKFPRHSCGACGLTDTEESELDGQIQADEQWREKLSELAGKIK